MKNDADTVDPTERMVLRTVYLPPDLDEKLRVRAFRDGQSKGDLIRRAIAKELAADASFGSDGPVVVKRPIVLSGKATVKVRTK